MFFQLSRSFPFIFCRETVGEEEEHNLSWLRPGKTSREANKQRLVLAAGR